ncbi:UNVERIFIED_CONTAM: putative LRR receptor-like serine/threonine-protein kinase [Sesamum latifolium]|uniref:non-specific serine/threonine protein kinase n=1 Tax=Sesamum latifolium TaxID=2727402 RepID=A0AAW2TRL6_9LAMI
MTAAAPPMRQTSRRRLLVLCCVVAFGLLMETAGAQTRTTNAAATTDPLEARAVNTMFQRWGISATNNWNISGELCSGAAIDDTEVITLNPGIKCDCSYNNGSTCHITALRVQALNVSGPIPDELWNLTYMDDLNLGVNYLTGPISASIGNLNRMQYLTFGANALSGVIPREIGLLADLRSLSFNTNNFSGPLPSELGNLSRLAQIYVDSSGVRGPIPPTFANLRSLERVKLQGNLFEGPIPPSFSGLTSLNDLRISELSNGIPSLDFLRNMTSLATLVLRNNNISGPIPSFLGELPRLALLDLSFNNLMGTIPNSLFDHRVLTNLYLGNNRLTGALPLQKSPSIRNIDLSYNELSGSFPSWVGEQNLQLNLVVNNFTIGNSNGSALPSGLNCLQRSFPCYRGSPIYSSFAINCGGPQIRSSDKIIYDMDNEPLGPATHYMTRSGRWAVSNVGLPVDGDSPQYQSSTSSQLTNTLDPGLFQTARISAGSLRYYGLGLENGKGTCCTPAYGTYGPLISAISVTPDFVPSVSNNPPGGNKNRTGLIVGITVAVAASLLSIVAATCYYVFRRRKRQKNLEDIVMPNFNGKFNKRLGEGGFGPVYKGTLEDGRLVAVKQLSVASRQGKTQFLAEIATISAVQHRNLVKLYGCCIEIDKRLLVYEYLENKSLDQLLFGTETKNLYLDWTTRYGICLGVARGLAYLHEESRLRIVHRDVKASNILLDSNLTPKISDFGLAKLYDDDKTHISTRVAGTIGYLAPEYAMRGRLTEKADIFSFGVVALEIVSGRPNFDPSLQHDMRYLLGWAWNLHKNDREIELVDPTLPKYDANTVKKIIDVALLCTQASPALRPSMSRVVAMLTGDVQVPSITSRPGYLTDWKFTDATTFATDAESSTSKSDIGYMNSTTSATMTTDLSYMNSTTSGDSQHWIQDRV